MSAKIDTANSTKTINESDTHDGLVDNIADMLLIHNGDEDKVRELIEDAWGSAYNHYHAEKSGDSDGFRIFIQPVDGELYAL